MLLSIALILLSGLVMGRLCQTIRFPALFGMMIAGVIIGPYALNWLDAGILQHSADLRRIALIIILIRAGLKLDLSELKAVGRPAVLMCFVPASLEIAGTVWLAPPLLGITRLEAAILGAVIAAVSPAVVVPRMIRLIDQKRGVKSGVPQMILAGASVDDVFVIVLFTSFTGIAKGSEVSWLSLVNIPLSVILGIAVGLLTGWLLYLFFRKCRVALPVQVILVFAFSFLLNAVEGAFSWLPFAGLIAIMALGTAVKRKDADTAQALSGVFDKLWIPAEIFLFVLVGTSVAIDSLKNAGLFAVLLVFGVLLFRMLGVWLCVLGTRLRFKERLFCMLAYTPKATVQAAIGGLPLAMGLSCGQTVLTVSVIVILITAPLGAFAIDLTCNKLLSDDSR